MNKRMRNRIPKLRKIPVQTPASIPRRRAQRTRRPVPLENTHAPSLAGVCNPAAWPHPNTLWNCRPSFRAPFVAARICSADSSISRFSADCRGSPRLLLEFYGSAIAAAPENVRRKKARAASDGDAAESYQHSFSMPGSRYRALTAHIAGDSLA
jgi:hypothetical protein